jgi:hypothetical protein
MGNYPEESTQILTGTRKEHRTTKNRLPDHHAYVESRIGHDACVLESKMMILMMMIKMMIIMMI